MIVLLKIGSSLIETMWLLVIAVNEFNGIITESNTINNNYHRLIRKIVSSAVITEGKIQKLSTVDLTGITTSYSFFAFLRDSA